MAPANWSDNSESTVELIVNGESVGTFPARGTIGDFVRNQALNHRLKSFSVYVNGTKFYTEQAGDSLTAGSRIELVAKDSRGWLRRTLDRIMVLTGGETPTPAEAAPKQPQPQQDGDPGDEQPVSA